MNRRPQQQAALAGLYIHVPFCSSVCPYCDFAVLIAGPERRADFVSWVVREAELYRGCGLVFDTLYLGGGTPSSLSPDQLTQLFEGVSSALSLQPDARFFLEVNPEDVTEHSAARWKSMGFETVSVGVQSLDDRQLAFLGRRHSARTARLAVERLARAGIETVSADLIFGLPDQDLRSWRRQLKQALELGVDHLSCYQLTVHPKTLLGRRSSRGERVVAGDETQTELFWLTHSLLADAGWDCYEVSNFASRPAHRSRHNLKYWSHVPYLGIGPSAHSFDGRRRWWNRRKLRLWQRALTEGRTPIEGDEALSRDQLLLETVMLGLRTRDGVDLEALKSRYGCDLLAGNARLVESLVEQGLIELGTTSIRPTTAGLAVAEGLAARFDLSGWGS